MKNQKLLFYLNNDISMLKRAEKKGDPISLEESDVRGSIPESGSNVSGISFKQITIGILIILCITVVFLFSKINSLKWEIFSLKEVINNKPKSEITFVDIYFWWKDDVFNNVERLWERSLSLPTEAKWKSCVIVWSRISGNAGWTLRQFLGKNNKGGIYNFADNYNAEINLNEQKIEISKWNWYSDSNLSQKERDSLYFSVRLLCK